MSQPTTRSLYSIDAEVLFDSPVRRLLPSIEREEDYVLPPNTIPAGNWLPNDEDYVCTSDNDDR